MTDIKFDILIIEFTSRLGSPQVVGKYRGQEAWNEIAEEMDKVVDGTAVLLDIKEANPLEYQFCQYAFGPVFQAFRERRWPNKYIIFRMDTFHKPLFFRGIIKYLGIDLPRKESENGFIRSGYYAKLLVGDDKRIDFIGDLTEQRRRILEFANEVKECTVRQVAEVLKISEETIVDELRFLVREYLLLNNADTSHTVYYSFYKYLEQGQI